MTLPRGYIRDERGQFVPPGGTVTSQVHSFLFGGSLPSGWGTSNSTTSIASPAVDSAAVPHDASNDGGYRVGTSVASTTVGDAALLYGPVLHMSRIKGVHFEIGGFYWNSSWVDSLAASLRIGLRSVETPSAGIELSQFTADATAQFRIPGAPGASPSDARYEMRTSGEADKRRTFGLLLLPGTSEVFLTEGDINNVVAWRRATEMTAGAVRPVVAVTAQEAVRKAFRFTTLSLTVWQH